MEIDNSVALFVGGTRSGKSDLAAAWLARYGLKSTYIATLGDIDGARDRVDRHRAKRPSWLNTVELASGDDLAGLIDSAVEPLLIDSLGTWLVRFRDFGAPVARLVESLCNSQVPVAVVAEIVGEGVHPPDADSMRFVDALGELTAAVRAVASEAYLVVAGATVSLVAPRWDDK